MKAIALMRLNQLVRFLAELGWWRLLLLFLFAGMAAAGAFSWAVRSRQSAGGLRLTGLWAALMLSLLLFHLTRPDKRLLRMLGRAARLVYAVEYAAALLPCLVFGLVAFRPELSLALALEIGLLTLVDYDLRANRFYAAVAGRLGLAPTSGVAFSMPWLPAEAFEWRSGLRSTWPAVGVLYAAGLFLSGHFAAVPVALFGLSLVTAGFYLEGESRDLLSLFALRHPHFLAGKLGNQYLIFWTGCLPLVLLHGLRHPGNVPLLLYAALAGSVMQAFSVILKYAHYRPNGRLDRNGFLLAAVLPGMALPHIAAIPVVMTIFYYRKARKNISRYLQ